jgi:uncharacterized protein YeeX (DUF496 family)
MDAYNIDSTRKENEQLLIESELKLGGRMSKETAADLNIQLEKMREEYDDHEPDFLSPRKRTDITKLRGALKLDTTTDGVEGIITPARKKIDLSQLIGAFNHKMSIEDIDTLTKSWRDEWERDFS